MSIEATEELKAERDAALAHAEAAERTRDDAMRAHADALARIEGYIIATDKALSERAQAVDRAEQAESALARAEHLATIYGCADHSKHDEDECALCRAEAALDAERAKRCGTCSGIRVRYAGTDDEYATCGFEGSPCFACDVSPHFGCTAWRQREEGQ